MLVSKKRYDVARERAEHYAKLAKQAADEKAQLLQKLGISEADARKAKDLVDQARKAIADLVTASRDIDPDAKVKDRRDAGTRLADATTAAATVLKKL